jgi:hypothetical protein
MFCYSALFTYLVRWNAGAVSFILSQLAYPLSDVMFRLHSGITNLSLYKHWVTPKAAAKFELLFNSASGFNCFEKCEI